MRDATMERMPQPIIQVFKDNINTLRKNKLKENALQIGDKVPNLPLKNIYGSTVLLSDLQQSEFLILNFYRGGWCPYCNLELREYERLRSDFNNVNADIIGISSETPSRANNTTNKNALKFPVLTDVDAQLMKAIGIVFQLDEATKREYENFGMDFTEIHGNNKFELPVPAVYVVNKDMQIVYTHFEENYMTRLEVSELLNILKNKLILKTI